MTESATSPARPQRGKAKRHHYIPELIQRRFAGPDLHLWSFDKRYPQYGIERKPIARLFREWDLYTLVRPDGTRDRSSEIRLSAIESRAGPILEQIVLAARNGRLHELKAAERHALVAFLIAQLRRSPDFFDSVAPAEQVNADVARIFREWEVRYGPATDEQRAELASGRLAARTRKNLLAKDVAEPLLRSTSVMLERGLSVAVVRETNRSFLLGSNPFARFLGPASRRNGLSDPGAEAWLPVAPDIALCSFGAQNGEQLYQIGDLSVRKINGVIAAQSSVIASVSRALVASFSRRHRRRQRKTEAPVA